MLSCRQYGQHWVPHTGYGHLHGLADPAAARALRCHQPPAGPSLRPGRRNLPAPHTHRRSVSLFSHAPCTPTVGQSACFPMHPAHPLYSKSVSVFSRPLQTTQTQSFCLTHPLLGPLHNHPWSISQPIFTHCTTTLRLGKSKRLLSVNSMHGLAAFVAK